MNSLKIFNDLSEHIIIKISSCVMALHDSNWIETKAHSDYDIWLIIEGNVRIKIGEDLYLAHSGDVIFFYPELSYTAYTTDDRCRFIYTHFNFGIGNNIRVLDEFDLCGILTGELIKEETSSYEKVFYEYKKNAVLSSLMLKGYFITLLARILALSDCDDYTKFSGNPILGKKVGINKINHLQPVLTYITDNIDKPIRINELASIAGMSEKYFIKYFKTTIGIPPGYYINQIKMNYARDYLYQRKFTIKEISQMLGYPDPSSFTKAFKKHYNVPPSKFID